MTDAGGTPLPLRLPPETSSAGQARRYVRSLLQAAGREAWVDAATLAVSELVTNAVLHAHTEIEVSAQVTDAHLRVEIRDRSPLLPSARSYDAHATTGRGLALVAAAAVEHGVESLGDQGKVVWFTVADRDGPEPTALELLDAWDDDGDLAAVSVPSQRPAGAGDTQHATAVLRGLPPTLWLAAREHHDALLRELALLHSDGKVAGVDLSAADKARFAISSRLDAVVARAREEGQARVPLPEHHPGALPAVPDSVDLVLHVPRDDVEAFALLQDALDVGEELARADQLLVRPGLPEIVAVRDWAAEQVIAQAAGMPPAPWPGAADERFTAQEHDVVPDWDTSLVDDAEGGAIAVDDSNRIIALSASLGRTLGYPRADLVGRRVVVIVPPRYREAHVAGFSRHLSTGDAKAIGADLALPVLLADGTELDCHFRIEAVPAGAGRNVYVAWITPR